MRARSLADIVCGRRPVSIARYSRRGVVPVATGRLVRETSERLVLIDTHGRTHHVLRSADLVIGGGDHG